MCESCQQIIIIIINNIYTGLLVQGKYPVIIQGPNSMECTCCKRWVHARCAKVKKVSSRLAVNFVCSKCLIGNDLDEEDGQYLIGVEKVQQFVYLDDVLNEGGGCEIAVSRRCHLGWARFTELASVLCGRRFL